MKVWNEDAARGTDSIYERNRAINFILWLEKAFTQEVHFVEPLATRVEDSQTLGRNKTTQPYEERVSSVRAIFVGSI